MSISTVPSPFTVRDTFQCIMRYLEAADIVHSAKVCKPWNNFIKDSSVYWKKRSEYEGIPLVDGKARNYREDFMALYPITISGRIIGQLFGKIVGQIPPISEELFNKLKQEDPFQEGKLIRDNYVFVVVPHLIARTANKDTPLALDGSGNLTELTSSEADAIEEQELKIPFSLKNLKVLCSYPLRGKENMPVFDKDSVSAVFDQCNTYPDKINVYFMRKQVAPQSKNKSYPDQEKLVKTLGFEVAPLIIRALSNSVEILTSGTCPDNRDPWTYARTSDTVRYSNNVYQSVIGAFAPRTGLDVGDGFYADPSVGVVPGVPAEVLRTLALDHLALDKEH